MALGSTDSARLARSVFVPEARRLGRPQRALFDRVCDVLEAQLPAQRVVLAGAGHSIPTLGAPVNEVLSKFWTAAAR